MTGERVLMVIFLLGCVFTLVFSCVVLTGLGERLDFRRAVAHDTYLREKYECEETRGGLYYEITHYMGSPTYVCFSKEALLK